MSDAKLLPETRPVLPLRCGDHRYALPLDSVVEVAAMVAVAPLPGADAAVLGIANRGGEALPILDLRRWLGMDAAPITTQTLFVVVRGEDSQIGLLADEVQAIRQYSPDAWQPMGGSGHWVSHSIREGDTLIQVLHVPALMSAAVRVMRT